MSIKHWTKEEFDKFVEEEGLEENFAENLWKLTKDLKFNMKFGEEKGPGEHEFTIKILLLEI